MSDLKPMSQNLLQNMSALEGRKIFIFGDIGIDEYVNGTVDRISPEAPVPVVEVQNTDKKLGLSGNVAANVRSLGGTPLLFSLVGEDPNANHLRELLKSRNISDEFLMPDPQRKTTTKLRVMSGQHHVVRVDYESKQPVASNFFDQFESKIKNAIDSCDAVIIQDYSKGMISQSSCGKIIQMASAANKKVLVDPYRSTPVKWYQGSHFMTPNRDEAFDLAKQIPKPEIWKDIDKIGIELMNQINSSQMVITLGSEGVKIFEEGKIHHLPTFARKVYDVTGAGDTVIAAFSLGIAGGWSLRDSAFLANMAAGVVVGQIGAVACSADQLKNYLQEHQY